MNKVELIAKVAEVSGLTKKDSEKAVSAIFGSQQTSGIIIDTVASGEKVELLGFGSFGTSERGQRKGRNPQTGEEVLIEARKVPKFKPGKSFKEAVR